MSGWDDPQTPAYYEAFCRSHTRYRLANRTLISHARLEPGMRVLDVAAGTGRTTEAALARLGDGGRVTCVEPSPAMRATGMRRVADPRVTWRATLPDGRRTFDRILCGAAIWQLVPLRQTLLRLSALLCHRGALCFNIPALYLLEADEPGGGSDPLLASLPALLWSSRTRDPDVRAQPTWDGASIEEWLREAGLRARSWSFRVRLTQEAYAAWLKIPALTGRMLGRFAPKERARRIDAALASVDRASWKWERWKGWTAWKP